MGISLGNSSGSNQTSSNSNAVKLPQWSESETYENNQTVLFGSELFTSIRSANLNNNPGLDRGNNWRAVNPLRGDDFSPIDDQFSTYNGTWQELNNSYNLTVGFVVTIFVDGFFDFNDEGSTIQVKQGDTLTYTDNGWILSKELSYFSVYDEVDQSAGTGQTFWSLGGLILNKGFNISGNLITVTNPGVYEITIGGGQDNASDQNSTMFSVIEKFDGTSGIQIAATTFSSVEIDGVGSRSGSAISCNSIIEMNIGDSFRIFSSGSQSSVIRNKTITIKQLPKVAKV